MKLLRKLFPIVLAGVVLLLTACPPPTTGTPTVYYGSFIISEVGSCPYTNISSWLEVYNNTAQAAQLSDFQLRTYGRLRTGTYDFQGIVSFSLPSLVVQPGSYVLIRGKVYDDYVNGNRIAYILNGSNVPNWVSDNVTSGSGFVEILKNGATVDFVKFGSNSASPVTASAWSGGNAPALPTGSGNYGKSIARAAALTDTNTSADWSFVDIATAGGPNDVTSTTDADNDGIPDANEQPGTTFAGLPLYDWGARVGQRDLFIHIDYMNSSDPGVIPREEALTMVVNAFLNTPGLPAADRIHVHFDVGTLYSTTPDPDHYNLDNTSHQVPLSTALTLGIGAGQANLWQYKNTYMNLAKKQIFHYLLMGYSQNADGSGGSSGLGEMPGNDFLVTLGNWGLNASSPSNENMLINFQAATIMHELGHNLGLHHGGDVDTNYKPNYYSIMNYMYQLYGLSTIGTVEGDRYYAYRKYSLGDSAFASFLSGGYASLQNSFYTTTFAMDYSNGSGGSITESAAVESQGLRRAGSTGIDFNGNGNTVETLSKDLNNDTTLDTFNDYNDWANINLFFQRGRWGDESGVTGPDALKIAPDPVGDDRQPIIIETLRPIWLKK